jgi:hypothetical protein
MSNSKSCERYRPTRQGTISLKLPTQMLFRLTDPFSFVFRAIARTRKDRLSFSVRLFIPTLVLFVTKARPDLATLPLLSLLNSSDQDSSSFLAIYIGHSHAHIIVIYPLQKEDTLRRGRRDRRRERGASSCVE